MTDRIFLLGDDGELVPMEKSDYLSEDHLQRLLASYPDLIPGDGIDATSPRRWLLIAREVGVPREESGASFWALDHLFLDQDGVPTLVEVKRGGDTRLRREVVGQMLDYAANGVAYWPVGRLQSLFEATCVARGEDPETLLTSFVNGLEDEFWKAVKTNLQAGRIRLVFVADDIPPELQRVVEFLNTQMDPAEVLAVEIPRYAASGLQTLVPRVIGQTQEARSRKAGGGGRSSRQWDRPSFLQELETRIGVAESKTAERIMNWCEQRGLRASFGQGSRSGSYFPVVDHDATWYSPFGLWTGGQVETQFQHLKARPEFESADVREELLRLFNRIPGADLPPDGIERRPSFSISCLTDEDALELLFDTTDWILNHISRAAG